MATAPRRFDQLPKVVADQRRQAADTQAVVLSRIASHTHFGASIPVVASTATITAPFTGQVIFDTTDNMLYRYTGSVWVAFEASGGGTAATMHEARYQLTAAQSFVTSTDTKVQFNSTAAPGYTCNDVVASGTGNTDFTVQRDGLWQISAALAFVAATGTRYLSLQTGSTIDVTKRFTQCSIYSTGTRAITCACSTTIRLTAGTTVCAIGWQDSGGALTADTFWGNASHIALTWIRP